MASAMKKMAVYLGLVEDAERPYAYDDFVDGPEPEATVTTLPARDAAPAAAPAPRVQQPAHSPAMPAAAPAPVIEPYRISTLHPRSYNDAKPIGLEFREGIPVIMNLTDMDDSDAKRLVDFAAGLVFAQRGTIERITSKVFLLSPANVDVTDQARARVAEGGFFNQS
jgi:cell division inhibitor SepF